MVEALGIIIDRCPKGRPCKMENSSIVKIGCGPCILLVTYYLSRKCVNMILDEFVVG
jgi:hypothetical protein